jgi:hypothetical protein
MQLQQASRKNSRIKMGIQGPSGSGKTYSALLVAFGLCSDWSKIGVVDTENHSAELYAHLGSFNVLNLDAPFSPERYIEAIKICEQAGMEVIIIDSLSHEWDFLLDYHSNLAGNSFTNWGKVTPRHNEFIQAILSCSCHVISTIRTKQDYVLTDKNGKMVPEKVGLKGIQRDGLEYDFTLVFDLDIKNMANASKDRTGLFSGKPEHKLSVTTGSRILQWCNSGELLSADDISVRIGECKSLNELLLLYKTFPQFKEVLQQEYEQRKRELILSKDIQSQLANQQISNNGKH